MVVDLSEGDMEMVQEGVEQTAAPGEVCQVLHVVSMVVEVLAGPGTPQITQAPIPVCPDRSHRHPTPTMSSCWGLNESQLGGQMGMGLSEVAGGSYLGGEGGGGPGLVGGRKGGLYVTLWEGGGGFLPEVGFCG